MNERKPMTKKEVLEWLKERQQNPLFVPGLQLDGMSISWGNPALTPLPPEDGHDTEDTTTKE